jgi:hypothetical protein
MNKPKVIAFYLPQYHPIPENDEWYGKGFTEWTNVGKAKPQFKGHYQPRVPADLGYYDLRLPQVRQAQADLAKEAGIAAFCYYHYWFGNGKQLLEMPFNEVVRCAEPDFPFCLAWANHTWYRKMWDSSKNILSKEVLVKQKYPGEKDIEEHFYSLLTAFRDKRYYKIHGKLAFVLYKVENIPDVECFMEQWQRLAQGNGLPGFFFISYSDDMYRIKHEAHKNCDATILSLKDETSSKGSSSVLRKYYRVLVYLLSRILKRPISVYNYADIVDKLCHSIFKEKKIYPVLIPNWDFTPRRGAGGLIFHNSTPELFKKHTKQVLNQIKDKDADDQIIFLKSWNEWGEGNYMEPDLKYGKGYIKALKEVLDDFKIEK